MEGKGLVLGLNPSSFMGRDGKTQIHMLYIDVNEETCKAMQLEMIQNPERPVDLHEYDRIAFTVIRQKEGNFGRGFVNVVKDVRVIGRVQIVPAGEGVGVSAGAAAAPPYVRPEGSVVPPQPAGVPGRPASR